MADLAEILARRSRKFLLSVGDEGAVLVYMVSGRVEGRFFFNNVTSPEIEKVFLGDTEAPIHVLVDVSDQSYLQHSLPPVSAMNLGKMVARRLEKEFERSDIKGALPNGRSTSGRKDWNFIFASIRNVSPLSDWLELLSNLPNMIAGIYLLPVETEPFVKAIKKAIEVENVAHPSEWQMLVTHNKTGGLRQVVYRNGRILFTRMAQPVGGNAPGVIAGHIEQETLSTMEYIRRMNFDEKAGLDIFIITAAEVKKQLESTQLKAAHMYVLTPHEVAGQLGFDKATEPRDKFADVVMLAFFGRARKAVLKLTTPALQKVQQMMLGTLALKALGMLLVPFSFYFLIYNIYTSITVHNKMEDEQKTLTRVQQQQHELQQRAAAQAERKADVEAMVSVYDALLRDAIVPFNFLTKLSEAKGPVALYQSLNFSVKDDIDAKTKKPETVLAFTGAANYPNRAPDAETYLKEVGAFAQRIRDTFKIFKVNFAGLPGQVDFTLSVEGGPTVAGAAPKNTQAAAAEADKKIIQVGIQGKIDEDTRKAYFEMPEMAEKKPAMVVPLQSQPAPSSAPVPLPPPKPAQPLGKKP